MVKRKIIRINEDLCDGCGQCIPSCQEGALKIIDGKAKLVKESYCDGLGACLGECPRGALSIVETTVEEFDEESVKIHTASRVHNEPTGNSYKANETIKHHDHPRPSHQMAACPSSRPMELKPSHHGKMTTQSKLGQWPVQLHLVPQFAPYFANADLYLIADCVPFAYPDFHNEFLNGHAIAVACPKLDNTEPYVQKIANIIKASSVRSITAVVMEVPCCSGLVHIAREAIRQSGADLPFDVVFIGIRGSVLQKTAV